MQNLTQPKECWMAIKAVEKGRGALASSLSKMWMLEWLEKNRVSFIVITLVVSLVPAKLQRLAYRRHEIGANQNIKTTGR